jgi:hypothetical protein
VRSDITKVGPLDESDRPRKPKRWFEKVWRAAWYWSGARFFTFALSPRSAEKMDAIERAGDEPAPVEQPWHGLQEAELTEEERNLAARRLAQQEALRKARGD